MHIISASRRTDIPAFYPKWFMNRVRDGVVGVKAPFGGKCFQISLNVDEVIAIMFWTKNAAPILPFLSELKEMGHDFAFHYTINNYPISIEPYVPNLAHSINMVRKLVLDQEIPIIWRYDTIILTDQLTFDWHRNNFEIICKELHGLVDQCIFSFCDYYKKTIKNMERAGVARIDPSQSDSLVLAGELAQLAFEHGISLASCSHDFLVNESISKARCINSELFSKVIRSNYKHEALAKLKGTPTRPQCGCLASRDIGAYDTCVHGCIYCYANASCEKAKLNLKRIDENAFSLSVGYDIDSRTVERQDNLFSNNENKV